MAHHLDADEMRTLQIVERTCSALSIAGIITIIVTFSVSRYFRNPIDRLILLNALFNIFDVTATMISLSGPAAGNNSALCQFQGFLMQMFPLSDVLWTLAMAIDVFLIVFYQYDERALHRLETKYIAGIGGITFVPALTFLFVRTAAKGRMYGSVQLWCAIAPKWVLYRIIFYYVPIWVVIVVIIILYCLVGWKIAMGKRALQSIEFDAYPLHDSTASSHSRSRSVEKTPDGGSPRDDNAVALAPVGPTPPLPPLAPLAPFPPPPQSLDGSESVSPLRPAGPGTIFSAVGLAGAGRGGDADASQRWQANRSALSLRQYLLMPVLFFVVLLAVWVAPTTNRLASFVSPNYVSYPLHLAVGATGSLRGFWNGVVFLAVGMRTRKTMKRLEAERPRRQLY